MEKIEAVICDTNIIKLVGALNKREINLIKKTISHLEIIHLGNVKSFMKMGDFRNNSPQRRKGRKEENTIIKKINYGIKKEPYKTE